MLSAGLVLKALRTRFIDQRPFILSHLITLRCNADCATCLWKMPAAAAVDELSTDEIVGMYRDAADAGFLALVLWGGEPLIRPDAGAALRGAREAGMNTTLITNGWFLEERAEEVLPWVNRLMVSVDAIGDRHDEIRSLPGLFERLDRGLRHVRQAYPDVVVIVNAVLSRMNQDQLETIAKYGKSLGAHVAFQGMDVTDYGYSNRMIDLDRVQLSPEGEGTLTRQIVQLRKSGFPVRDSNAYLERLGPAAREYRCHFKKVCLRVEPNGAVLDCTKKAVELATVREESLGDLTRSPSFREFLVRAEACNRCRDAAVVEVSHIWEGRVDALRNAVRSLT